ncbi:MAG: SEC-C metal-binding domain-containing protein [Acidobacteriota bacterium]|jgi:hypothetical protein
MFFRRAASGVSEKIRLPKSVDFGPRRVLRVGRNDPCPCGSGKKYKHCHEAEGDAFLQKLAREQDREQREERLKRAGVPWYKRLLSRARE